ncbi:hypothetical protein NicSoilB8_21870 [Arthrobacter sp. NicSoilB8]|nr:hypothetical protein NicSoilB8_21870 [Arthrobacter sp. NicSoilB8]
MCHYAPYRQAYQLDLSAASSWPVPDSGTVRHRSKPPYTRADMAQAEYSPCVDRK